MPQQHTTLTPYAAELEHWVAGGPAEMLGITGCFAAVVDQLAQRPAGPPSRPCPMTFPCDTRSLAIPATP